MLTIGALNDLYKSNGKEDNCFMAQASLAKSEEDCELFPEAAVEVAPQAN